MSRSLTSHRMCCGRRFARVARLRAWATVVATISVVAAGGAAEVLSFSHRVVAGLEALQLHRPRQPAPLRGVPLRGETGLRLVVADIPPFVLDVGTGRATPVLGIPAVKRGVLWVVGVAGRAAVAVAESAVERHSA